MLPVIPLACVASIALMGLFARSNRKEGWVKTYKPLVERLRSLKKNLTTAPEVAPAPSMWYAGMVINPTEFSQQLGSLEVSLQRANAPVVTQARAVARDRERERVAAGS